MLHPDGQYEPSLIPRLVEPILDGEADLVLGSRLAEPGMARGGRDAALQVRGQPLPDRRSRTGSSARDLSEMHTGYRAYSNRLLREVPFLRNALDFSFDSEMLMQAAHFGFRIAEVPARTRYFDDASSISLKPATVYGLKTLWAGGRLMLHRHGMLRSRKFMP